MAGPQSRRHVSKLIAFVTHDGEGYADVGIDIIKTKIFLSTEENKKNQGVAARLRHTTLS